MSKKIIGIICAVAILLTVFIWSIVSRGNEIAELKQQLAESKMAPVPPANLAPGALPLPAATPVPGAAPAANAAPLPGLHFAPPENRFFADPSDPSKMAGNGDGTLFVQATPDAGVLRVFPPTVLTVRIPQGYPKSATLTAEHEALRQRMIAAAKSQGLDAMCRGNQNVGIDSYLLAEWPAEGGAVLLATLRSPNTSAIRHKDTPVGGGKVPFGK